MNQRIALTGFARTGKDEIGKILVEWHGYERRAFGDIIKKQLDPLISEQLGFSAFTEDDKQKQGIRGVLEQWGMANYDAITDELFSGMPERCVNTRLCRAQEARRWIEEGGEIWNVTRPNVRPATEWEFEMWQEIEHEIGFDRCVRNDGTLAKLRSKILEIANLNRDSV